MRFEDYWVLFVAESLKKDCLLYLTAQLATQLFMGCGYKSV